MLRVAAGERLGIVQADVRLDGWAIESRVYAEDPYRGFLPSIGRLSRYRPPASGESGGTVVRNDTGVHEGGEISLHYDPMIAKLCTHGPDRATAVEAMSRALDRFELEGIAHNVPFLAAVMAHPRFRAGDITTAFIDDEFPDGFAGVEPDAPRARELAACAVWLDALERERASRVAGARFGPNVDAALADADRLVAGPGGAWRSACDTAAGTVRLDDGGEPLAVASTARAGEPLVEIEVDGRVHVLQVTRTPMGFRLRGGGTDARWRVLPARVSELLALMPDKGSDAGENELRCPMPGLLVKLLVGEGERVEAGQQLAIVEAMKMENVLSAERDGTVETVHAAEGASLTVDEVILSFAAP